MLQSPAHCKNHAPTLQILQIFLKWNHPPDSGSMLLPAAENLASVNTRMVKDCSGVLCTLVLFED